MPKTKKKFYTKNQNHFYYDLLLTRRKFDLFYIFLGAMDSKKAEKLKKIIDDRN